MEEIFSFPLSRRVSDSHSLRARVCEHSNTLLWGRKEGTSRFKMNLFCFSLVRHAVTWLFSYSMTEMLCLFWRWSLLIGLVLEEWLSTHSSVQLLVVKKISMFSLKRSSFYTTSVSNLHTMYFNLMALQSLIMFDCTSHSHLQGHETLCTEVWKAEVRKHGTGSSAWWEITDDRAGLRGINL